MVSGFVTSPCDQLRIFSGEASMMRMASKSVIGLVSSNGFERNKASLLGRPSGLPRLFPGFLEDPSFPGGGGYRFQRKILKTQLSAFSYQPSAISFFSPDPQRWAPRSS
jgi:hypothetical protein